MDSVGLQNKFRLFAVAIKMWAYMSHLSPLILSADADKKFTPSISKNIALDYFCIHNINYISRITVRKINRTHPLILVYFLPRR